MDTDRTYPGPLAGDGGRLLSESPHRCGFGYYALGTRGFPTPEGISIRLLGTESRNFAAATSKVILHRGLPGRAGQPLSLCACYYYCRDLEVTVRTQEMSCSVRCNWQLPTMENAGLGSIN